MPITPAQPMSRHSKMPIMIVNNGAVHIEFNSIEAKSKRLTSFDSKLTTFPGAVSPNALCDNRRA